MIHEYLDTIPDTTKIIKELMQGESRKELKAHRLGEMFFEESRKESAGLLEITMQANFHNRMWLSLDNPALGDHIVEAEKQMLHEFSRYIFSDIINEIDRLQRFVMSNRSTITDADVMHALSALSNMLRRVNVE